MLSLAPAATILAFGTFFTVLALVAYRLLWAAAQLSMAGSRPRKLLFLRRWLHSEPALKK
jgi:hypothetical protein